MSKDVTGNEVATIIADRITIASGYKCEVCGLIRPFNMAKCPCTPIAPEVEE